MKKSRSSSDNLTHQSLWSTTLTSLKGHFNFAHLKTKQLPGLYQLSLSTSWFCAKTKTLPRKNLSKLQKIKSLVNMLIKKTKNKSMKERNLLREKNFSRKKKEKNNLKLKLKGKSMKQRESTRTSGYWCSCQWQSLQPENQHFSAQFEPTTKTFLFTFCRRMQFACQ